MESFFNNQMVAKTTKNWASGGLVQRVGADSVGYQESGNTSGFVQAKRGRALSALFCEFC